MSDYFITLKISSLYHAGVKDVIELEGGIELNPKWQKDIYNLKKVNVRFLLILLFLNILLYIVWLSTAKISSTFFFETLLGMIILSEAFIHTRHFHSLIKSKAILVKEGIEGKIRYKRPIMHRMAALDALTFAGLYLLLYILVGRFFFLGGAATCLSLYTTQKKWLKKNQESLKKEKKIDQNE